MLVLIGSEKGGVGKSTIAAHAAVRLALTGKTTVLIDYDPQLTSYRWTQQRTEHRPDAPAVAGECLAGDIRGPVAELARRYHHLVVDVGGADTKALRSGLMLANRFIIPSRVARRDIETLSHVASLVRQVRERRQKPLHARVVFNMTRALPNFWTRIDGAAEAVRSLDMDVCPYPLVERLSYDDSQRHDGSMFEHTDAKAESEMNRVLEALLSRTPSPAPEGGQEPDMSTSRGSYSDSITDDFIGGAEERARQHVRTRTDQQVMLNVRVDPEMRRDLKRRAVDEDRPMRDIIVDALTQYLDQPQAEAHGFDDDGL